MTSPIRPRHLASEARDILPEEAQDRLASAGLIIVEEYVAKLLQSHLEEMMQQLITHKTSKLHRDFQAKAQHSLHLIDTLLGET